MDVLEWYVKEGDVVEQFTSLVKVQSDKATTDITSPFEGTITKLCYAENDVARVGEPLIFIDIVGDGTEAENASTKEDITQSKEETVHSSSSDMLRGAMDAPSKGGKVLCVRVHGVMILCKPCPRTNLHRF